MQRRTPRSLAPALVLSLSAIILGCGGGSGGSTQGGGGNNPPPVTQIGTSDSLQGDTSPVHDPSIIKQGSTYYVFSTDPAPPLAGYLQIRCSQDKVNFTSCGYVFSTLPSWVRSQYPTVTGLWAPDISFFNGTYHLYYVASLFGTNNSAIGLATNTTLDSSDPNYAWVDQGPVIQSTSAGNFNAIDPNLLIGQDGKYYLTYGSFWNGIFQQTVDPSTGLLNAGQTAVNLAQRPLVSQDPIEGASILYEGGYYYLFVSFNFCCESNPYSDNYEIAVGRSSSPGGPYVDKSGTAMLQGGGTILLTGNNSTWNAPGGQTAYDDGTGPVIVFHALQLPSGLDYLWLKPLTFANGWPTIGS